MEQSEVVRTILLVHSTGTERVNVRNIHNVKSNSYFFPGPYHFPAFPLTGFEVNAASRKLKSCVLAFGFGFCAAAVLAAVLGADEAGAAPGTVGSNCPGKQAAKVVVGCLFSQCRRASVLDFDIRMGIMHWVQLAITVSAFTRLGNLPVSSPVTKHYTYQV